MQLYKVAQENEVFERNGTLDVVVYISVNKNSHLFRLY